MQNLAPPLINPGNVIVRGKRVRLRLRLLAAWTQVEFAWCVLTSRRGRGVIVFAFGAPKPVTVSFRSVSANEVGVAASLCRQAYEELAEMDRGMEANAIQIREMLGLDDEVAP
jgi:hypothetical protein